MAACRSGLSAAATASIGQSRQNTSGMMAAVPVAAGALSARLNGRAGEQPLQQPKYPPQQHYQQQQRQQQAQSHRGAFARGGLGPRQPHHQQLVVRRDVGGVSSGSDGRRVHGAQVGFSSRAEETATSSSSASSTTLHHILEQLNLSVSSRQGKDSGLSGESLGLSAQQGAAETEVDVELLLDSSLLTALQVEGELATLLDALRDKENELARAEILVKEEARELRDSRELLRKKEADLEAVAREQAASLEEVERAKEELTIQEAALARVRESVSSRDQQLEEAQTRLREREEAIERACAEIKVRSEQLSRLRAVVADGEKKLAAASARAEAQRRDLAALHGALRECEQGIYTVREECGDREVRMRAVQADLANRERALRAAGAEVAELQRQLAFSNASKAAARKELANVQGLLKDVVAELSVSRGSLSRHKAQVSALRADLAGREKELEKLRDQLKAREHKLALTVRDMAKSQALLKSARPDAASLQQQIQALQQAVAAEDAELRKTRGRVAAGQQEQVLLSQELAGCEQALQDAQVGLQLREADLQAARVEMQALRDELEFDRVKAQERAREVVEAARAVEVMEKQLAAVRSKILEKEQRLEAVAGQVEKKEEVIAALKADMAMGEVRAMEVEQVVKEVVELSRKLADSVTLEGLEGERTREGEGLEGAEGAAARALVQPGLVQTSVDLLQAKQLVWRTGTQILSLQHKKAEEESLQQALAADLQSLKTRLQRAESELGEVQTSLHERETRMHVLLRTWEKKEAEVARMQDEVVRTARELEQWKQWVEGRGAGVPRRDDEQRWLRWAATASKSGSAALPARLQLEMTRADVDAALEALKGLADLSKQLRSHTHLTPQEQLQLQQLLRQRQQQQAQEKQWLQSRGQNVSALSSKGMVSTSISTGLSVRSGSSHDGARQSRPGAPSEDGRKAALLQSKQEYCVEDGVQGGGGATRLRQNQTANPPEAQGSREALAPGQTEGHQLLQSTEDMSHVSAKEDESKSPGYVLEGNDGSGSWSAGPSTAYQGFEWEEIADPLPSVAVEESLTLGGEQDLEARVQQQMQMLQQELEGRDAALALARRAMESLSRLTRSLVHEHSHGKAGIQIRT